MNKNILSIDAETNSLWSKAFAIAATLHNQEGKEIKNFIGRCPIKEEVNTWVEENVIPQIQAIEKTRHAICHVKRVQSFNKIINKRRELGVILTLNKQ